MKRDVFNSILITNDARGRRLGGIISGTPLPGTIMQIKASTEPVNGKYTFEVYNRDADGNHPQGPIWVLLEDYLQGQTIDDAYVDGSLGQLYSPLPGDNMLCIIQDVGGTSSDSHAIGEILMVDDGTGELIATTGTPETEMFVLKETLAGLTADVLGHVEYSGH